MPKKMLKDIATFGVGSMVLGGSAAAVGRAYGTPYSSGLASMGGMMSPLGSIVMAKHTIRLGTKLLPKRKRRLFSW
jgi:hypothetical protein